MSKLVTCIAERLLLETKLTAETRLELKRLKSQESRQVAPEYTSQCNARASTVRLKGATLIMSVLMFTQYCYTFLAGNELIIRHVEASHLKCVWTQGFTHIRTYGICHKCRLHHASISASVPSAVEGAWQPAVPPCQRSRQLQTALESSLESDFQFAGIVCLQKPTSKNYVTRWMNSISWLKAMNSVQIEDADDMPGRNQSKCVRRTILIATLLHGSRV